MSDFLTNYQNNTPAYNVLPPWMNAVGAFLNDLAAGGVPQFADDPDLTPGTAQLWINTTTDTLNWTPDGVTVLSALTTDADLDAVIDSATRLAMTAAERTKLDGIAAGATVNDTDANLKARGNHTGTQLAETISDFAAAVGAAIPVAPSQTVFRVKNTTSQTGIVIDSLNIDLLTGYSGTVPDLNVPVVVMGLIPVSHSVANVELNPVICKTSPAPTTILDSLAMGFQNTTTIGRKGNCLVWVVLEPNTPCTVQLYLSGTGGTAAVPVQTYAPGWFMAWTL